MTKETFSPYQKIVVAILAFLQFTIILDFMVLAPLGAVVIKELAITPSQFGLVVSAYAFSAGVSGILAAGIADRFDGLVVGGRRANRGGLPLKCSPYLQYLKQVAHSGWFREHQRDMDDIWPHLGEQIDAASLATLNDGGIAGVGLGNTPHKFLNLLPAPHTDSIFALIAEEFGFIGGIGLIAVFVFAYMRQPDTARLRARQKG